MAPTFITGAAGFIGSHLAERLLQQGELVVGIDNFDPFYDRQVKWRNLVRCRSMDGFRFVQADIRDFTVLQGHLENLRPKRVIHLAARAGVRPSLEDPAGYIRTNVEGTANLLRACAGSGVEHFVFASSSSVYGETTRVPFREDDPPEDPHSPYAATKQAGEAICRMYHRLTGMDVTCLRFFTVYGPRQRPDLAIHKFVRLILEGKPIPIYGDGTTSRDYTYVEDTVRGILAALNRPSGCQTFNIGNGDPVSLMQMVGVLERHLGRPAIPDPRPVEPGDVTTTYADLTKARDELGYAPQVSFDEGVRRFVEWLEQAHETECCPGVEPAAGSLHEGESLGRAVVYTPPASSARVGSTSDEKRGGAGAHRANGRGQC